VRFRSADDQRCFDARGFAVVPVFGAAEVAELLRSCEALLPEGDGMMFIDYARGDRALRARVNELLNSRWEEALAPLLDGQRIVFSTIAAKPPGPASRMYLHDDRTFVDERIHRSLTAWAPLVDTSAGTNNGGLQVVPRSHHAATSLSGTSTPDWFTPYEGWLADRAEPLHLSAGTGVIYDSRLLHVSPENVGSRTRIAVLCAIAPKGAPLIHAVGVGPLRRRVHRVDDAFFIDHAPADLLEGMPGSALVLYEFDELASTPSAAELATCLGTDEAPVAEIPPTVRERVPAAPADPKADPVSVVERLRERLDRRVEAPADPGRSLVDLTRTVTQAAPSFSADAAQLESFSGAPALPIEAVDGRPVARHGRWTGARWVRSHEPGRSELDVALDALAATTDLRHAELTLLAPGTVATLARRRIPGPVEVHLPVLVAPGASGVQDGNGVVTPFRVGEPVLVDPTGETIVWNDAPWPALTLVLSLAAQPTGPAARLRARLGDRLSVASTRRRIQAEQALL
jgi:hypothetical protein